MKNLYIFLLILLLSSCKEELVEILGSDNNKTRTTIVKEFKGVDGQVYSVTVGFGQTVVIGGRFQRVDNLKVPSLAKLNNRGEPIVIFNENLGAGPNGDILAVHSFVGGEILVAGDFSEFNGRAVGNIVCLKSDGRINSECTQKLGSGSNGPITRIKQLGNHIVLAGEFTEFNSNKTAFMTFLHLSGQPKPIKEVFESLNPTQFGLSNAVPITQN